MRSHALVLFLSSHSTKHTHMRGGILEVLLVNAEGIRHTNLIGTGSYYVVLECGTQVHRSKVSSGEDDKAWWNEKFLFELPLSDWKNFTHLKIRIMDTEFLTDSAFIGETMIYLGGIVLEGVDRDFIEIKPAPYNVVLEDDTYEGQIKIGIKYIANKEVNVVESGDNIEEENEPTKSICSILVKLWRKSRGSSCFSVNKSTPTVSRKIR